LSNACLIRNEWRRMAATPFAWLLLAAATALLAYDFLSRIDQLLLIQEELSDIGSVTDRVMMPVIAQTTQLILLLVALMSLRGLAAERRLGTMSLLRSAPLSTWQLAIAKLIGLLTLPGLLILAVTLMAMSLALGTSPDWGRIAAGLLGLSLLAITCAALALMVSSLARSPALAATLTFCVLILFWIADFAPRSRGVQDSVLTLASMAAHFRPFLSGTLLLSSLVFFLVLFGAALTATFVMLDLRFRRPARWSVLGLLTLIVAIGVTTAHRHDLRWDWTESARNSLSDASLQLLGSLKEPVRITAYASQSRQLRQSIGDFLAPYQHAKSDLDVQFIDPATAPDLIRELDIRVDGELLVEYLEGRESLRELSEAALGHALMRLSRTDQIHVAYSTGSGERDLRGQANFDLGSFSDALTQRGINCQPLDLVINPVIPDNLRLLIITQPRQALMPGINRSLAQYVANGGNLLWLSDPGGLEGLEVLATALGLRALPGIVVDARASQYDIANPRFTVVSDYPDHPLTQGFAQATLYPQSIAWEIQGQGGDWLESPLVMTHNSTWTETGAIEDEVRFDPDGEERAGPLMLAVALERPTASGGLQRAVAVGDADFLSNRFLGNAGNLDLGLRMVSWLLEDDQALQIPARFEPDSRLELSRTVLGSLGFFWLLLVPAGLCLSGSIRWWRRKRA
jgi:ABC-type transport system involved in multi-copper enzyme maturation permease subunit